MGVGISLNTINNLFAFRQARFVSLVIFGLMAAAVFQAWAETLEHHLPANVTLHRFTGETLDPQSVPVEPEHWLLVDFSGKRTRFISEFLTGKSTDILPVVVILDNSDWYRNGARLLTTAGYREIPFYGMKSGQTWISCTSFFFLPARIQLASRQPFYQPEFSRSLSPEWDRVE